MRKPAGKQKKPEAGDLGLQLSIIQQRW